MDHNVNKLRPSYSIESSVQIEEDSEILNRRGRFRRKLRKFNLTLAFKLSLKIVLVALYNIYMVCAIHYHKVNGLDMDWCGGLGFLIIITLIVYISLFHFYILKPGFKRSHVKIRVPERILTIVKHRFFSFSVTLLVFSAFIVFLVVDTVNDRYRKILIHSFIYSSFHYFIN